MQEKKPHAALGPYAYTLGNLKVLMNLAIKISMSAVSCVIVDLVEHSHAFTLCFYMQIICVIIKSRPGLLTQSVVYIAPAKQNISFHGY